MVSGTIGLSIVFGGSSGSPGAAVYAQPITPLRAAWGRTLYRPPAPWPAGQVPGAGAMTTNVDRRRD